MCEQEGKKRSFLFIRNNFLFVQWCVKGNPDARMLRRRNAREILSHSRWNRQMIYDFMHNNSSQYQCSSFTSLRETLNDCYYVINLWELQTVLIVIVCEASQSWIDCRRGLENVSEEIKRARSRRSLLSFRICCITIATLPSRLSVKVAN